MTWVQVSVVIELNIGDETLDDDLWMEGLIHDLKGDLAGFQWYIDEAVALDERETEIAERVAKTKERV